jgi:excisionase family DNA binding protein
VASESKGKADRVSADPKRPFSERDGVLLTRAEAADYLGVTERQIWRLLNRRDIPKIKVGGLVRIHLADLEAYIESRRVEAGQR